MRGRKPTGLALLVAVAAMLAMAIGASGASATQVTAENATVTLTQSVQAPGFVAANAFATTSVQCEEASGTFTVPSATVPPANNTNRPGVGPRSTGSGSVTMDFNAPPSFEECEVYAWVEALEAWVPTEVEAVVTTSGGWSLSATQNEVGNTTGGSLAIAVPPDGATIEIKGAAPCTITVSPSQASSVNSDYTNANRTAVVDGQLDDSSAGGCGGPSPAQYEAQFTADNGFNITY